MILSFKKQFVQPILDGTKIHTIRRDPGKRWREGMKIHFWEGSPRNKGRSMEAEIRRHWGLGFVGWWNPYTRVRGRAETDCNTNDWWPVCTGVQEIEIKDFREWGIWIRIDGARLSHKSTLLLIYNDGLDINEFREWFIPNPGDTYTGRIIHWTEKRY